MILNAVFLVCLTSSGPTFTVQVWQSFILTSSGYQRNKESTWLMRLPFWERMADHRTDWMVAHQPSWDRLWRWGAFSIFKFRATINISVHCPDLVIYFPSIKYHRSLGLSHVNLFYFLMARNRNNICVTVFNCIQWINSRHLKSKFWINFQN